LPAASGGWLPPDFCCKASQAGEASRQQKYSFGAKREVRVDEKIGLYNIS